MAVLEHSIHPSTIQAKDAHPGCWNQPRKREPYPVKTGFRLIYEGEGRYSSEQLWKTIPDVGSLPCRSDCPECIGCDHYDTSYVEMVKLKGK